MASSSPERPTKLDTPGLVELDRDEAAESLLGTTLQDTYILHRLVGEGGMGLVFEAHHTRIAGKRYAIKVLRSEMASSQEVRTRFQREADAAASIDHPNVVGVFDFGYTKDGRPYIVNQYLEGLELGDFIEQQKQLSPELAVYIARQVCHALEAAHDAGVIHRDLKPENIYLTGPLDRPKVKVLDFGLSRFTEMTGNTVTRTGLVMGTPAYMSPEQARGDRADHRVDIYGVGAILYTALTGRAPFNEESPQQTVLAVMSSEPERPRKYAPTMPEELELVVQRAMAREVSDRYQSMPELDAALELFDVYSRAETGARPPRGALMSRVGSSADDVDVGTARSELVFLLTLALLLGLLGLVTTIVGLQDLFWGGRQLSSTEFVLVLAAVIGTLITPLVLTIRFIRRRLWNNSVRIVELIPRLRGPLIMAVAVYGGVTLLGRAFDGFGRALNTPPLAPNLSGWAGWGPILFVVALITAVGMVVRRRLLPRSSGGFLRRMLAGPGVFGTVAVATIALIGFGRARSHRPVLPPPPGTTASAEPINLDALPADSVAAVVTASAAPPSSALVMIQRAPTDEVADAISKGAEALLELRKRYPKDPAVLEPLARALGRDPASYSQAIDVLGKVVGVYEEDELRFSAVYRGRCFKDQAEIAQYRKDLDDE